MSGVAARAVHVVRCRGLSILQQLRLEEALLRADDRNWCILNDGAPPTAPPAIVMGISGCALPPSLSASARRCIWCLALALCVYGLPDGVALGRACVKELPRSALLNSARLLGRRKVAELVNVEKAIEHDVPVIKRYSGGGTVRSQTLNPLSTPCGQYRALCTCRLSCTALLLLLPSLRHLFLYSQT